MHPWIEGVRTCCALVWRYFYKPCTHCSGSDVARALGWQQLQSAVAVRRDSLADESKPPHAELCAIIAINMQALRGEYTPGKSGELPKHGNSKAACRDHDGDRIARQTKNQPRCPRTDARQHCREHRSSWPLRKAVEHRMCTKTLDHLWNVVVMTHGDAASQDHRVR